MVLNLVFLFSVILFWISLGITDGYRMKKPDLLLSISRAAVSITFLFSLLLSYDLGIKANYIMSEILLMIMCVIGTGPLYEMVSNKIEFGKFLMPRNLFYFERLRKFSPPSYVFPIIVSLSVVTYILLTIGV
jgi:hypothetical protein